MGLFKGRYKLMDGIFLAILLALFFMFGTNELLYHTVLEMLSIVVAFTFGVTVLNTTDRMQDQKIAVLGIAYLFVGLLDFFHVFSFPGINVFGGNAQNITVQIWIAARTLEVFSFLLSIQFSGIMKRKNTFMFSYGIYSAMVLFMILKTDLIPIAFDSMHGLSKAEITMEILGIVVLLYILLVSYHKKNEFVGESYNYIIWAIIYTILSESSFMVYTNFSSIFVATGHTFKVLSFYMLYKGVVVAAIKGPYEQMNKERIRFYTMFEKDKDAVLLLDDSDLCDAKIIMANERACNMFGYLKHEIKECTLNDLVCGSCLEENHFFEDKPSVIFEAVLCKKDKSLIYADVNVHSITIFDQRLKLVDIRDVSLRKRFQKESVIFQSVFENTTEAIFITNAQNEIEWVNKSFLEMYGYKKEEILGEKPEVLKSDKMGNLFFVKMWESILKEDQWVGEMWNRTQSGKLIPVYQSIVAIRNQFGKVEHYISINVDITEQKKTEEKMFKLSYVDPMTDLYNRNYIHDIIPERSAKAVYVVKIENLSNIQKKQGVHKTSEIMQSMIGQLIQEFEFDAAYQISFSRIALVYFSRNENLEIVDQILHQFSKPLEIEKVMIHMDLYIGYLKCEENQTLTLENMIENALTALEFIEGKKNQRVVVYSETLEASIEEEERLVEDLRRAVHNNEIVVYYQPIVNNSTGEVFFAEALARWKHPQKGFISPAKFIDLAERNGLIIELGNQILKKAGKQLSDWIDQGIDIKMSVNASVIQLENPCFSDAIKELLLGSNIIPNKLIIEITENVAIENLEIIKDSVSRITEMGVLIALDDFGTGYSSMELLKELPISILKIDRIFMMGIHDDIHKSMLVAAMTSMAKRLGFTVVVEGVEDPTQLRLIHTNHAKYVQGFLFSKPVDAIAFDTFLKSTPLDLTEYYEQMSEESIEKIEHEKKRFKDLHDMKPMGYQVLNLEGKILDVNNTLAFMLGYERMELIGMCFFDFFVEEMEGQEKFHFVHIIEQGGCSDVERKIFTRTNEIKQILVNCNVINDENNIPERISCLVQDITQDLENQRYLIRMREVYRKVFEDAPIAYMLWDKDYSIMEWNNYAKDVFGWSRDEVVNKKLNHLINQQDIKVWKNEWDRILSGIHTQITMQNRIKGGDVIATEWVNEPIYSKDGDVEFVLSIIQNVTLLKEKEKEINGLRERMIQQERLSEIGQLAAGIAHEINNPLSYLLSNAEMLQKEFKEYVEGIKPCKEFALTHGYRSSESMEQFEKKMLFIEEDVEAIADSFDEGLNRVREIVSGLKTYAWKGTEETFNKYDVVENLEKVLVVAHNELKYICHVEKDFESDIPEIEAIGSQINQVVLNFLINAKHAIEEKYEEEMGAIHIKATHDKTHIYITISDDGIGIDPSVRDHIFEPFYTTKPEGVGTGLGLSISYGIIVEKHNGEIKVESEIGKGSTFVISLPIKHSFTE